MQHYPEDVSLVAAISSPGMCQAPFPVSGLLQPVLHGAMQFVTDLCDQAYTQAPLTGACIVVHARHPVSSSFLVCERLTGQLGVPVDLC